MGTKSKAYPLLKQYLDFLKTGKAFEGVLSKVKIISASEGNCKAEFTVDTDQANALGVLHGGFSATVADVVSGLALLSSDKQVGGFSININMMFLKSAQIGDEIVVEAKTIKAGKNVGFAETKIKNKKTGELLVTASHTKYYDSEIEKFYKAAV